MKISKLKALFHKIFNLLRSAKTFSQEKNSYIYVTRQLNPTLFKLLDKVGFFKFHITNRKKQIVGVHQIVLFCSKGWKKLQFGLVCRAGATEVHHLDHNPQNNQPSNLWYVTPTENKVIAVIATSCCQVHINPYQGTVLFDLDRLNIGGGEKPFYKVLVESLIATSNSVNGNLVSKFIDSLPFKQAKQLARFVIQEFNLYVSP